MRVLDQMGEQSVEQQPLQQGRTTDDESTALTPEIKDSTCQKGDGAQGAERRGSELILPEDILYHIHALMPMRDAARAAGVSCGFRRSWEFYPKLILDIETLGINEDACNVNEITCDFISIVDHIMQNHSGIGVKIFRLRTNPCDNVHPSYVDRWLQGAIIPGIEEFELQMPWHNKIEYNFPCSLLSTERGRSMQSFLLADCAFHSAAEVGCLSNLMTVYLSSVHITGEELRGFLSNCWALERLDLSNCSDIVRLKIPSLLSKLNFLQVQDCVMLETIESNVPNLSQFNYVGRPIHISFGDPAHLRHIRMMSLNESNMLYCASTKLPSIAPNLQTLLLASQDEVVNTPMVH
uniref:At1g61320/AtMIF1 LRR domain-containing protein n=1 Tax=Arundo donax TaxID=35708 RepID=A0A0A9CI70_ARUDO